MGWSPHRMEHFDEVQMGLALVRTFLELVEPGRDLGNHLLITSTSLPTTVLNRVRYCVCGRSCVARAVMRVVIP